ncbi:hypothetical protein DV532_29900 (plasmid) [Pseudomonas sp. Leaf58]|nr:hypothetical protein DV532_29900 [Pseudomonas sp. Leaf58]KQN62009.1 hypothetical protein ASF02_07420 [Pseudomonas sp. Leaf58]
MLALRQYLQLQAAAFCCSAGVGEQHGLISHLCSRSFSRQELLEFLVQFKQMAFFLVWNSHI